MTQRTHQEAEEASEKLAFCEVKEDSSVTLVEASGESVGEEASSATLVTNDTSQSSQTEADLFAISAAEGSFERAITDCAPAKDIAASKPGSSSARVARAESTNVLPSEFAELNQRFEVTDTIAQGGMGTVFKATDRATGKIVAIKVLHVDLTKDAVALKRFEMEADAAKELNHPNLVAVFDHGTVSSGAPYIVMDFLEGQNLSDMIQEQGMLEPAKALEIFVQVADGLLHAHEKGIVHRDIKPSNVILTKVGDHYLARLVDFGIATALPSMGRETRDLTQTGDVFGSPHYMSPEQCLGFMTDQRSDIYSFGCLMYETLTGSPPFGGSNPIQLVVKHINDEPPHFSRELKTGKLINKLESITFHCMEKEQSYRFQSVKDLLCDLELVKTGKTIPKYVRSVRSKPTLTRNQAMAMLAGICTVLFALPMMPDVIDYSLRDSIKYILLSIICAGGTYAIFTTSIARLKKIRQGVATPRQWSLVVTHFCIAVGLISFLPYLLTQVIWRHGGVSSNLLESAEFVFQMLGIGAGIVGVLSLITYLLFRTNEKVRLRYVMTRIILLMVPLAAVCVFVIPGKTALVTENLSWSARSGFPEVSMALSRASIFLDKTKSDPYMQMAYMLRDSEKVQPAIDVLTDGINAVGEYRTELHMYRALCEIHGKQYDQAIADADTVISNDREASDRAHNLRGNANLLKGDLDAALSDYSESIQLQPGSHNEAYMFRIAAYCRFKQFDKALAELDQMQKMRINTVSWFVTRGLIMEKSGHQAQAIAQFQNAISACEQRASKERLQPSEGIIGAGEQDHYLLASFAAQKLGDKKKSDQLLSRMRGDWFSKKDLADQLSLQYSDLDFNW